MRNFLTLLTIGFLGACGTTETVNLQLLRKPVTPQESRLIITRNQSMLYLAGAADIALDGKNVASLARGASVVEDTSPGKHFLTVKAPGTIGDYTTSFETKAGKVYNFIVSPNEGKSLLPGALLGQLGETIDNSGYFQVLPAASVK